MTEKRRRGAELEQAIFAATNAILKEEGFEQLSFQKVAERAGTSKPVLYRRWASTFELVLAAIREPAVRINGRFTDFEPTGASLADDLLQMLLRFSDVISEYGNTYLQIVLTEISRNSDRRGIFEFGERGDIQVMTRILKRATDRGETVRSDVSESAMLLPFTQARYAALVRGHVMSADELAQLVTEILLPVYLK
ncbi:TetR/AcrR family transcriptional regulator [Furfurilactobacillus siliginis]|uniref:Transcriptional regulator n=1 Tax=Furfurilactobacillus siliginis TaxID=348151 RepID=A0A0R2LCE5_9LACO|nr:TetR/AcrR family transcriptional regulator [Furfurilactobacillus siliginis]KRN96052.1 transcriptional regulator [Furfurilactobacillus siliginis]GEK28758.1 TetR family transcriptional regulator [Furfurilactobacillus siliginis]